MRSLSQRQVLFSAPIDDHPAGKGPYSQDIQVFRVEQPALNKSMPDIFMRDSSLPPLIRPRYWGNGWARSDFQYAVADEWGRLVAQREISGKSIHAMDAFIAATARVHGLKLVTRNVSDFSASLKTLVNPWI